jgi:hypothetical protein
MAEILLIEDRTEQAIAIQLNLNVYVGASVRLAATAEDVGAALARATPFALIVSRAASGLTPPENRRGGAPLIETPEPLDLKAVLSSAARILKVTAEKMAETPVPERFPIPTSVFAYLERFPCEVARPSGAEPRALFAEGQKVDAMRIAQLAEEEVCLTIGANQRLRFVNTLTERLLAMIEAAAKSPAPDSPGLAPDKRIRLLGDSLDRISDSFRKAGLDEGTARLARTCISGMEKLAKAFPSAVSLLDRLMQERSSYRYAHSQLITFVGLHLARILGWEVPASSAALAEAAFFHDLILETDAEAETRGESLALLASQERERVDGHASSAAALLEKGVTQARSALTAAQIVREHHGSPEGRGFPADVSAVSELSKGFILAERYADFLIAAARERRVPDKGPFFRGLRAEFPAEDMAPIIEGLRFLDPSAFMENLGRLADEADSARADEKVGDTLGRVPGLDVLVRREWQAIRFYGERFAEILKIAAEEGKEGPEVREIASAAAAIVETREKLRGIAASKADQIQVVRGAKDEILSTSVFIRNATEKLGQVSEVFKVESKTMITDLMAAAKIGDLARVEALLAGEKRSDLTRRDSEGRTTLHYASMGGNLAAFKLLVAQGLSIREADSQRRTPLFYAVLYSREEIVEYMLEEGANANQQTLKGFNLAMLAAYRGVASIFRRLVKAGARLNSRDYEGKTVADYATASGNAEILGVLQAAGSA